MRGLRGLASVKDWLGFLRAWVARFSERLSQRFSTVLFHSVFPQCDFRFSTYLFFLSTIFVCAGRGFALAVLRQNSTIFEIRL